MHFATLLTLLAFTITTTLAGWLDDIVGVPSCARNCAKTLPPGCTNDPTCVCANKAWMNDAQCCVAAKCSASDVLITQQFASQLCNYVNKNLAAPSNCPKATTLSSQYVVPTAAPGTYPAKIGNYAYQGCYKGGTNNAIVYGTSYLDETKMTQDACYGICNPSKYKYMGLAFGHRCFCGNDIEKTSVKQTGDSLCQTKCVNNAKQLCGGNNYLALWKLP